MPCCAIHALLIKEEEKEEKEKKRVAQPLVPIDFLIARVSANASLKIFMREKESCFAAHNTVYTWVAAATYL